MISSLAPSSKQLLDNAALIPYLVCHRRDAHCQQQTYDRGQDCRDDRECVLHIRLSVQTRLTAEEEFKEFQDMYRMVGLVSSLILGGIGILNLINMILTGVIARQKEFASMRSIGMTKKQLRKMIVYEGMYYAVLAGVVGIAASGVLSLL